MTSTATTPAGSRLKFKEYSPHIEVSFWYELERRKLHEWRLQEPVVPLTLFGTVNSAYTATPANIVSVRRESLGNDSDAIAAGLPQSPLAGVAAANDTNAPFSIPVLLSGELQNFNTLEQLCKLPRREAIWRVLKEKLLIPLFSGKGSKTIDVNEDRKAAEIPVDKVWEGINFALAALFTYADLKSHRFHYMMAFPVLDLGSPVDVKHRVNGGYAALATDHGVSYFSSRKAVDRIHAHLLEQLRRHPERGPNPFIVTCRASGHEENEEVIFYPFTFSTINKMKELSFLVVMADVSTMEDFPGWPARNVIGALRLARPSITAFALYCIRHNEVERSVVFECTCDPLSYTFEDVMTEGTEGKQNAFARAVGWTERKSADSPVSCIDLGAMMDPERLAESSARLNLSLMKWRMLPELSLDGLASCRALVLGSGTLGCNVARHLLMWGVTKITLVDRGNVSFSNPVRQTLFEMSDVINPRLEERNKAVAAAKALKRILPTVEAHGVPLTIHMPGHRIDKQRESDVIAEVERLDTLIQEHDVVFLLTDSRESRWLPTLMATTHNKPLINAALGFDTYVVMRHGLEPKEGSGGSRLGCYFCSDVVAPRDSMTARSLDQQCTVTRPGLSAIASATAVELLAQLYNHPLGFACPPYTETEMQQVHLRQTGDSKATDPPDTNGAVCVLGNIPHQIRGSVLTHYIYTLYGYRYELCTACSDSVVGAYRRERQSFVLRCVNDPLYIEEVCGVKAFKESFNLEDLDEWDIDSHSD